jgi:predicted nucleic acid-binding protein
LGLSPLRTFLKRHRRIAIDTSIFIYYLEANPRYVDMAGEVFSWLERSPNTAVTSTLTMTELLNRYFGLLTQFPHLEWVAPDLTIADAAAQIRAHRRLRTPDALQAATAICRGATAILNQRCESRACSAN